MSTAGMKLWVGIIGSGDVGQALGKGFASCGYDVKMGSRTPDSDKLKAWAAEIGKQGSTGLFSDAAKYGEVIVLAIPGMAVEEAIDMAGPGNFVGKLVVDATNPLDFSKGSPPGLFVGTSDSLGERVQRKVPSAKVVKCFNTVPSSQMFKPSFKDIDMLICGNDAEAKVGVTAILKEFGWKGAIDVGGIDGARWLEALVPLWVRTCTSLNSWDVIFKAQRVPESLTQATR